MKNSSSHYRGGIFVIMKKNFCFVILSLLAISCSQIVDNTIDNKNRQYAISTFAGNYIGKYSGDDSGSISIEVTKLGTIKASLQSAKYNISENFQGNVNKYGDMEGVRSQSGFYFKGNLLQVNGVYKGTWDKNSLKGEWYLEKK